MKKVWIAVGIIISIAFLYVWQRIQIFRMGYQIRNVEKRIEMLQEENAGFLLGISGLESPQNIKKEIDRLNLGLGPPSEKQIVRLKAE